MCCSSCPFAKGQCDAPSVECVWRSRLEVALQRYFKFKSFRQGQLDALLPLVHGRDVFVRMATGAGKSLCLFLAPLAIGNLASYPGRSKNGMRKQSIPGRLSPPTRPGYEAIGNSAIGVVISPLNALMDQQVQRINECKLK